MKSGTGMLERGGSHFALKIKEGVKWRDGCRKFLNATLEKLSEQQATEGEKLKAKQLTNVRD